MANSYYNHGTVPATNAPGSSAAIRAELDAITAGFALLPTLAGNGSKIVAINAGGTAMSVLASIDGYPIGQVTPAAGSFTTLSATGAAALAAVTATTFTGNGAAITALNASNLASGTVPSARVAGAYTAITAIGNTSSALSFAAAGNITISAPSSGVALVVNGLAGNNTMVLNNAIGTNAFQSTDGTCTTLWGTNGASGLTVGVTTNHPLALRTNNTDRVAVTAAGNVTVNAPSSGVSLTVTGITAGVSLRAGLFGSTNNPRIDFTHTEATPISVIDFTGSASPQGRIALGGTAVIDISANRNVTIAAPASGATLAVSAVAAGTSALNLLSGSAQLSFIPDTGSTAAAIGTFSAHALSIRSNSVERIALGTAGNVAVNAPTSGTALTVSGFGTIVGQFNGPVGGAGAVVMNSNATTNYSAFNARQNGNNTAFFGTDGSAALVTGSADGDTVIRGEAGTIRLAIGATQFLTVSSSGHSTKHKDSGGTLLNTGFLEVPQNLQNANYTTVLADSGKHIGHTSGSAHTHTIDSNANVAYPIGATLTFWNGNAAGNVTIAITTDTMRLAPGGTTGSRTLAANGRATALKVAATEWQITGIALT